MDITKARSLTDQELADELGSARRQLYDLRFQLATRQLTDYSQIPQTRRTIARLLTVQTERERGSSRGATAATAAPAAPAERGRRRGTGGTR